jgi:hypothetical protein
MSKAIQDEHGKGIHSPFNACMYRDQCRSVDAEIERLRETLRGIVDADWRTWDELASPEEFVSWAKSRANHALQAPNPEGVVWP